MRNDVVSLLRGGGRLVWNLPKRRPDQAKSNRTVKLDGRTVLGGRFQKDAPQAGGLKTSQRLQDESPSKTLPSVIRANADVLHGTGITAVGQTLNRSAVDWCRIRFIADSSNQPRRLRKKRPLTGDFEHQPPATFQRCQRREDLSIQLVSKAAEFRDSVAVEVFGFPMDEAIPCRQFRIRNVVLREIEFHSKSTEIPHDHSNLEVRPLGGTDRLAGSTIQNHGKHGIHGKNFG